MAFGFARNYFSRIASQTNRMIYEGARGRKMPQSKIDTFMKVRNFYRGLGTMGDAGYMSIAGGLAGGIYGAFADDTSFLGGMAIGAGLGAGSMGVARLGRVGHQAYSDMYSNLIQKHGRKHILDAAEVVSSPKGKAAHFALWAMGNQSKQYISNTYAKASNAFYGLKENLFGL